MENTDIFAIRKCSYNPEKDLVTVNHHPENPEQAELYLPVKNRLYWMQVYCEENGINYKIDESELHFLESIGLMQVVVKIFFNDELVTSSTAGDVFIRGDDDHNSKLIQNAATKAKGRALSNLGFGTVVAASDAESGDFYPVDAGIQYIRDEKNPLIFKAVPKQEASVNNSIEKNTAGPEEKATASPNPDVKPYAAKTVTPPAEKPARSAEVRKTQPVSNDNLPEISLEEAYNFVLPIGSNKGKTMSEVAALKPDNIRWFASDEYTARNETARKVKAAAKRIIEHLDSEIR